MDTERQITSDIFVQRNQDPNCLTIRHEDPENPGRDDDLVHICDWPAFKAAVDTFQLERGGRI